MPRRKIERLHCFPGPRRGKVYWRESLMEALRKGDIAEFGKLHVGAEQLRRLLRLMPGSHIMVHVNGRLEMENAGQKFVGHGDEATSVFITAQTNRQWFGLADKAWVKPTMETVVAIRPNMLGKK